MRVLDIATPLCVASCALFLLPESASAGPQVFVMSLSDGATLASGALDDEELVVVGGATAPRKFLSDSTLAFYFGDRNGDGLFDEPNDVDAIAFLPPVLGRPMVESLVFSILTDQNGIKDGDVVRFDPTDVQDGLDVLFSEAFLVAAIQANDGNLDVDAAAFAPDGSFWFSLAEDETVGPQSVVMQDETVFMLPQGATTATVAYSATQMETFAKTALGITTAIGDVMSLEFSGTELLFTVQSPTAHDATILSVANGGTIHQGHTESSFVFGVDVECDALGIYTGPPFPSLDAEPAVAAVGAPLDVVLDGATPNAMCLLVLSGTVVPGGSGVGAPGFGALVASPFDSIFLAAAVNASALLGVANGLGVLHFTGNAPAAGGLGLDLAIQAFDASASRFSAPVVLELLP